MDACKESFHAECRLGIRSAADVATPEAGRRDEARPNHQPSPPPSRVRAGRETLQRRRQVGRASPAPSAARKPGSSDSSKFWSVRSTAHRPFAHQCPRTLSARSWATRDTLGDPALRRPPHSSETSLFLRDSVRLEGMRSEGAARSRVATSTPGAFAHQNRDTLSATCNLGGCLGKQRTFP